MPEALFVGDEKCISCHENEVKEWQASHHNQAMQHAEDVTVLGDFNKLTTKGKEYVKSLLSR